MTSVPTADLLDGIEFSELFDKLHSLTVDRGIFYTITECLLDQVCISKFLLCFKLKYYSLSPYFLRLLNVF